MATLQHYKNFEISAQQYDPELQAEVIYHVDEDGRDWYALQKTFSEDTIKVGYNAQGFVCTVSEHVYAIAPTGLSIVEVNSLPAGFSLVFGAYEYLNGAVVMRIPSVDDLTAAAEERRRELMSNVSVEIATLDDIAQSGTGTEQELKRLTALKQYRIALMRLDINEQWPVLPA
ncbi:caudovirales tail fiber assembly family protein [Yersinia pseudotuberculosis IP 32953]|uniref:Putative bacteriophage protein n=1 Tax=Yersinia pseudotuberculosis serotype I (strain IP32953) TaxID=273123 RepID=Q666T8_YERPS|nr:tail assembly chaperone [Yersinia pseudotuberculosis]AJJ55931.1 caudovirales tail fiber assembly family protein [Yersinia pseudotuberculosis IP 32953]CAH22396.1 Putative bacteriophage protein [Yersinia pseudotuberculosis IP 32953]